MLSKLALALTLAVLGQSAAQAACTTTATVRKGGGGTCTTIQQCVDAVGVLAGDYCINVDSSTYSEQVTIQGKTNNGFRLIIQSDPALVSTAATVNPPALSAAAFHVLNDSVTIANILIVTTNTVNYGVWSSSAHIILSSVSVDSGGNIAAAAMNLDSFSAVSYSSVTVGQAYGIALAGSGSTITLSTISSNMNFGSGLYIDGSSNTISGCTISNPNGQGIAISDTYAAYNRIDRSTITTNTGSAAVFIGGTFTTLSRVHASNPNGGHALRLNDGADYTTIDLSTFTGVNISGTLSIVSSSNSITRSFISNLSQNALSVSGSYNEVRLSTISINTANNYAAEAAGSYNSFGDCLVTNPLGEAFRNGGLATTIHRSTITSGSATIPALYSYGNSATVTNSYIQGSTAVWVQSFATILNSNILVAGSGAGSAVYVGSGGNHSFSSNTVLLAPQAAGFRLNTSGSIVIATNTVKGGRYGVRAEFSVAPAAIWIASNTFAPDLSTARDVYGLYFGTLASGATVTNNAVVIRAPGSMGAFTAYGLYAQDSAGLVIDHNRFSNPGLITAGSFGGVTLTNTPGTIFKFNDVHSTGTALANGYLLQLLAGSSSASIKNNVFSSSMAVTGSSATLNVSADSQKGFASDYNDFFSSNSLNTILWGTTAYALLPAWQSASTQDYHSWSGHPQWNDPAAEDFHPLSALGRFDPVSRTFVADAQTSVTIDAGDSAESFALEPSPNGGVANQGSYGNTTEASKSAAPAAANPPLATAFVAVTSDTVSMTWSPNGNRNPGTDWEVWRDVGPGFGAPTLVVVATAAHTFSALATDTTYYFRVRAKNAAGVATAFDTTVSTKTLGVPGTPGVPSGTALGTSSISWTWAAAAGATSYDVYPASEPATRIATPVAAAFTGIGLSTNTGYGLIVAGEGPNGRGPLAASATVYTLAAPPAGTAASAVNASSAVISWTLNTNPAATTAQLQRSTDNAVFQTVFSSMDVTYTDVDLVGCTSYYYRVRNLNGDGVVTAYDTAVNFLTQNSTPLPPGSFTAASLTGNRIALSWAPSATEGVTQYRLYFDNGAGAVSYAAPLAVLTSTETSYTTGVLTSSAAYRFGLRPVHRCGMEDPSTSAQASAAALAALTGIKTALRYPASGQRVRGDRVTLLAEQVLGSASDLAKVRFQYRPSNASAWINVAAAGVRANPVTAAPYFVHWNTSLLTPGDYDLRAVASNFDAVADAAPPSITVAVLDPADPSFDVSENVNGGHTLKDQVVSAGGESAVFAADAASTGTVKVVLPAGALNAPSATLTLATNPALPAPPPAGSEAVGAAAEITLSSLQTALSNGRRATLTFSYADANDDGIVDNTTLRADRLALYAYNAASGQWTREFASTLDARNRTITGLTPHFSFFAVFGAPAAADLSTVRVYPNPFKPNGANRDEGIPFSSGDPNSGVVFDNLPAEVVIRIYSVAGQLVAQLPSSSTSGKLRWDARNDSGRNAASGNYFAVITSPGHKAVIKQIMIIR